jgi:hypothetical protein
MLLPLSDALIEGREPEQRVAAIVQQFLAHPDINSVISILARQQLGVNKKELVVVERVMDKLRDAIATHRNLRDQASLQLYQVLLNIISSPRAAKLQRATARLFGLKSREGLKAAQIRIATRMVDVESGLYDKDAPAPPLLAHSDRRERSDWTASEPLRKAAGDYWKNNTRVTSCTKAVMTLDDDTTVAIQYLETSMDSFYCAFLKYGNHFYPTQLLVRHLPEGTTNACVRKAFEQWKVARVNPMKNGKYYHVSFSVEADCKVALRAGSAPGFSLAATITQRPLIGYTAFANERPVFVKDATAVTCVCQRCQAFVEIFKGAVKFSHWDECCPQFAELLEDVATAALPVAANVKSLLDVLLCSRDPATDLHRKACCYGTCGSCGWDSRLPDMRVHDEIDLPAIDNQLPDVKEVFVSFKAYENKPVNESKTAEGDRKEEAAAKKKATRPVLMPQSLSPSAYLALFHADLLEFQKHRFPPHDATFDVCIVFGSLDMSRCIKLTWAICSRNVWKRRKGPCMVRRRLKLLQSKLQPRI